MADGRKASTSSGNRYFTRRRSKKPPEIVELSDSSIESNDDERAVAELPPAPVAECSAAMECPVCLQPCIHPARLPCGHVFCFLCLKGIAHQSRCCAMCRQEISPDYLDRPDLLESSNTPEGKETETFEGGYQWFYEGRNGWWQFEERLSQELEESSQLGVNTLETLICGTLYVVDLQALVQYNKNNPTRKRKIKRWWQYDERTSRELEASYKSGSRTCELLIAGFLYTADFDAMVQTRRTEPHRRRRIKRDLATIPKKGIAGIRCPVNVDSVSEQLSSLTLSDSSTEQE